MIVFLVSAEMSLSPLDPAVTTDSNTGIEPPAAGFILVLGQPKSGHQTKPSSVNLSIHSCVNNVCFPFPFVFEQTVLSLFPLQFVMSSLKLCASVRHVRRGQM